MCCFVVVVFIIGRAGNTKALLKFRKEIWKIKTVKMLLSFVLVIPFLKFILSKSVIAIKIYVEGCSSQCLIKQGSHQMEVILRPYAYVCK